MLIVPILLKKQHDIKSNYKIGIGIRARYQCAALDLFLEANEKEGGGVPNAENLIPNSQRTPSELARMRRNGGIKSGETRRKKANLKKTFEMLAQMKIAPDEMSERLEMMGLDPTGENAIAMAMMLQAMSGDVKAFAQVAKYLGQDEHIKAQIEETKERTKLVKSQREMLETKGEPEQFEDDGFIEALKGTAASDWVDYKDDGEDDTED